MTYLPHIICGATGLAVSLLLIPFLQRMVALQRATGRRTFHHTHKMPVSRFGGIALAAAFAVVSLVVFIWFPTTPDRTQMRVTLVLSSLAMFVLGLADDFRPLGAKKKLIGQILIASVVAFSGIRIEVFQNPFTGQEYQLEMLGSVATVLWLVFLTNLINLIDGVDGLAGGISLMLMALLAFVGLKAEPTLQVLVAVGMSGALLGFLRYNFPPARIYMGDGGAYLLGFLIGILTLVNSQKGTVLAALVAPLFALALPIVDVTIAILRRGLKGLPIFRADRRHIHHRLQQAGLSRTRTVLVLYAISSVCLLMAFAVFWSQGRWVPMLFGFMCLTMLLSARTFNFSRDWFAVGRVLENSLELRKETHYALAAARWLELEAERSESVDELWEDFTYLARKLGFASVHLQLNDGEREWSQPVRFGESPKLLRDTHDLSDARVMVLKFTAEASRLSDRVFEHLCELAAEAWLKAATRWEETNNLPLEFKSRIRELAMPKQSSRSSAIVDAPGKPA